MQQHRAGSKITRSLRYESVKGHKQGRKRATGTFFVQSECMKQNQSSSVILRTLRMLQSQNQEYFYKSCPAWGTLRETLLKARVKYICTSMTFMLQRRAAVQDCTDPREIARCRG